MIEIKPKDIFFYKFWLILIILTIIEGFEWGFESKHFVFQIPQIITCVYAIVAKTVFVFLKAAGKHVTRYENDVIIYGAMVVLIATSLHSPIFEYAQLYNLLFLVILIIYAAGLRKHKIKEIYQRFKKEN